MHVKSPTVRSARHPAGWLLALLLAPGLASAASPERAVGNLQLTGIPEISAEDLNLVAPYLETRSARLLGWVPDGGAVIRTRFASTEQLHLVTHPLGARHQLTFYSEPVRQAVVAPREARVAFLKDRGGDENYGLFLLDLKTRQTRELSDPGTRNGAPVWSRDGRQLAFYSNARDGKSWDIHVVEPASGQKARRLLATESESGAWWPLDFSVSGAQLLLLQYFSINDSRLWLLELASGTLTPVQLPPAGVNEAAFARGGAGLWVSVDAFGEFRELIRLDPVTGARDSLTAHLAADVELFAQSDDGDWLGYTINDDGFSRLNLIHLSRGLELELPLLPGARVDRMAFLPGSSDLALTVSDPAAPGNLFRLVNGGDDGAHLEQWTASETGGLDRARFSNATSFKFATFDQVEGRPRQLQALRYAQPGNGPHPVLIDIHGGPEGQAKPTFDATLQLLAAELGFVILRPNVRGSAGFGRSFLRLDNGRRREDAVQDIGALLDWIAAQPELDHSRVVVMGSSYGGYMVLASLIAHGERLLGGIDRVGISNFVSFLENTSDYRRDLRRAEYGDERDPQMRTFLDEISPMGQARRIAKPLLIFQGRNDPRVPVTESRQMVAEIQAAGGEVWYMEAADEGHGIRRKANQRMYYAVVVTFLRELLERQP